MATLQELERATEESTSKYVDAGGIRIHYNEVGTGDPVLCLHGGGPGATGWSNFKQNITDIAAEHRMLMMDMPGWGKSDYPENKEDWFDFIGRVIEDFLDAVDAGAVDVIGNSMGGQAGLGLALRNPDRLKHLVLIGSQPTEAGIVIQPTPQEALANISAYYAGDGPSLEKMERLVRSLVYDSSFVTPETLQERYESSITPVNLERGKRGLPKRRDLYSELSTIAVPTLIVWGQEDKGGALEVGLQMLKLMQKAQLHVFQRCGHWAQVEYRDAFDRIVLDFFKS
jgi:pimeloyl-ACP methyl ester carboxylesterase